MATPIDIREEAGVRTLHFGSEWIQGAMRIARPWNLELEYTREMMAALLLRDAPRKVLLIGLGAASLTKFLYRHYPLAHLTVVEIEPAVVAAARQFFKLPEDPKRLNIVIGDGAEYMLGSNRKFDLILVDGFNEKARAGALETLPFYQACRGRLGDDGVLAVNLLTRSRSFKRTTAHIAEAFEDRALLLPSCESGNAIAFAAAGNPIELSFADLKESALALKEQTGLYLLPTLVRLAQAKTCLNDKLML
ncbi:MAG: spermidine synthase [Gallionellales bacterium RIFCSPLOWO2_12_FULL_59_22]|nr:MAG: spermidine synthase [Gallionellales bacterium RIFCSPLOWO2_02_FULL_59_110]OGT03725.1 MAG: spermidine synthase [Gallionellales bacterium RIFCSPLOWO2_02_58_13]OGT14225.1 MAG: spermidine synthase [Gallionellales bacterium RIFCSPLOWO2_12_FULL_59_22]